MGQDHRLAPLLAQGESLRWSARPDALRSTTPGQLATFTAGVGLLLYGLWRLGTLYGLIPGDDAGVFAAQFRGGSQVYVFGWLALAGGTLMAGQLPLYLWSMSGTAYHITDRTRVLILSRGPFSASQEKMDLRGPRRTVVVRRAFDWLVAVELLEAGNTGLALVGLAQAESLAALALLQEDAVDG